MKSKGVIANLNFPQWLQGAIKETEYRSLHSFCIRNNYNPMTYCNKNKYNNYTLEDIVRISYQLNNAAFLRSIVKELNELLQEEKPTFIIDTKNIIPFGGWLKEKLKERNVSLRVFCLEHNLNYNTIYSSIRRENFKEKDKELMCTYLKDHEYYKLKKELLEGLQ